MAYTNIDEYQPTETEKKLLEVLLDPANYNLSVTNICKKAGVVRQSYYDAMKKPQFREYMNEITRDVLKGKVANLINAAYKFAIADIRGHQDRKMLLEMVGEYTPKEKREITGETTVNNNVKLDNLSYEQLKELLKE